jgi:rhodanese-related sulfurtransferase
MSASAGDDYEVEPEEAARRIREDAWALVDVREPYEVEAGRIAGSRHIVLERLAEQAGELDRERPVLFVCRVGSRSGLAAQAFRASGWDAYNLRGGITAWVQAGLPIEPEGGRVAEH